MTTKEQLYEKLSAEYAAFVDGLKGEPPDKIIDSAYEKVFKEEILSCFESGNSFSEQQITAILALDYPLDELYRNWLDTDVSYMDDLSDTIHSFATREVQEQNGIVGEEITEADTQSDTHTAFVGRIEQNMKDYANGKLSRSEQDTDAICMSEAYMYLSAAENLSNSDMQYLLRFHNPLQVIADVYSNLDGTPGIEFALNRVLDNYNGCTNGYTLADRNTQSEVQISQGINGELNIGDWVIAAPSDEYGYLLGVVTAIDKLGTPEHDTENTGDDIHVDFYAFDYPAERITEIEEIFSDLYGESKTFDELPLDDVIMAPDVLIRITELGHDEITRMGNLLQNCVAFCNCFPGAAELQGDLHAELMERIDKNLTDYNNSLMGFGKRELIDMAGKIAAMKDVYDYMTTTRGFDDDEMQFYLQFQNPLEVVADAWLQRNADNEDLSFSMDYTFERSGELLKAYPLISDIDATADSGLHRFMDVDLIDFLGKIAGKTIIHNPEDWQSHSNALYRIADAGNSEYERLMWLVSSRGAQMYLEQSMFIKETPAFIKCVENPPNTPDTFGYVVEVTGRRGNTVIGNVFEVGSYADFANHVLHTALPLESITRKYSNDKDENAGKTITVPRSEYDNERQLLMSENGKVTSIQYNPSEVVRTMSDLLHQERLKRMAYPIGNTEAHLIRLSEKLKAIRKLQAPERPPADKKLSIGDRIAAGNEKVKAYKEQKAQNPDTTTKHKKEDVLE